MRPTDDTPRKHEAPTNLEERVAEIETRADLVALIEALRGNLQTHPEEWENPTLDSFLGALAGWAEDMDGYDRNRGQDVPDSPTWRTLGEMLTAARIYE